MGEAGPGPGLPLLPAVRHALVGAPGGVALRLPPAGPLTGTAHRRRATKALLQEAALADGGQVFETVAGDLLLLATAAPAAARIAALLARLGAEAPPPETWTMPADAGQLLTWAEGARLSPRTPHGPAAPAPGLAGLDERLDTLPLHRVVRQRPVLWHAAGAAPALAARWLAVSRAALRTELGALAPDPDLLGHAEDRIATRLSTLRIVGADGLPGLAALLAAPSAIPPAAAWLVPLPLRATHDPAASPAGLPPGYRPGVIGVLPLIAAADPAALARRRQALAAGGWRLALAGLDAAALRLMAPAAFGADLLLLRWSPALADRAATALVRGHLQPDRLVLTACDGPEAIGWGEAVGIRRFAGPQVASLLAASRMLACPAAAGCTRRQCTERAAATDAAGRAGCRNAALLSALLPGAVA